MIKKITTALSLLFVYILLLCSCNINDNDDTNTQNGSLEVIEVDLNEFLEFKTSEGQRVELDPDLKGSRNKQISIINDSIIVVDYLSSPEVIYRYDINSFELINKFSLEKIYNRKCVFVENNHIVVITKNEIIFYNESMDVISSIYLNQEAVIASNNFNFSETTTLINNRYILYFSYDFNVYIYDLEKNAEIPISNKLNDKNDINYSRIYPSENNFILLSGIKYKKGIDPNGSKNQFGESIPFNHSYAVVGTNGDIKSHIEKSFLIKNNQAISADNQILYSFDTTYEIEDEYRINYVIKNGLLHNYFKNLLLDFNNKKLYDLSEENGVLCSTCSNGEKVVILFYKPEVETNGVLTGGENYFIVM